MDKHIATLAFIRNHTSRTSEEIASLDAAIALMRGQSELAETEQRSLNSMADAWMAVVATCLNIDSNALASYGPNGRESIVAFIKRLSQKGPSR